MAERTRSQWLSGLVCLRVGLRSLSDAITDHGLGGRWLSAPVAVMGLAVAASSARTHRRALRSIDAIRRRWSAS